MDKLRRQYQEAFEAHGDSPESLFAPKGRQKERFKALTAAISLREFSILDFGCGLAHLKGFLDESERFDEFSYVGADIVPEFINTSRQKYPDVHFMRIDSYRDVEGEYDFILLSGVFNMLYREDQTEHWKIVRETLAYLFCRTKIALAVDFMTDQVDFMQEGAFHLSPTACWDFVSSNLSKRIVLDQSVMPYEYTVTLFKDELIMRPSNLYREIPS